ncbi:MAG TPA: CoA transferase [Geminicoccaceae bacterium]
MLPLRNVRVIAVEQYGAGPFGTQFLADLGAEVIKIENPKDGGDVARSVGPYSLDGEDLTSASLFFQSFNRNKRSLTLDLGRPEGREILHDLARTADALCSNMRGDVPDKLGLTYRTLGEINPKLVCSHLTAYGREGSRRNWPGYDFLMQAEAGYFSITGEPGTPPARMGLSIVDMMTGLGMAYAMLAALLEARETGRGRDIDVSLFDFALFNLNYLAHWHLAAGHEAVRLERSAHPSLTPCALYKTADGWVYLMCNKEKFWGTLCTAIGREDLIDDPRFRTFRERFRNRPLVAEVLDAELSKRPTAEWLERFGGKVPAAPVYGVADALANPFVREGGRIQALESADGVPFELLACPVRVPGEELPARPGPKLGADTDALLEELGYDQARIAGLREREIV